MPRDYHPKSQFLRDVLAERVTLSGTADSAANLARVIALTRDTDVSNRDWAVFLLGQSGLDTPALRVALRQAMSDADPMVAAEAILALTQLEPAATLGIVQAALKQDVIHIPTLEAAKILAHPSLIDDLRDWSEPSDNTLADRVALAALEACATSARA